VYANHAVTPTASEPDLSTAEGVLALVTQNTSTNTDKAKREDFLNLIETRDYDETKGHYRSNATSNPINRTTGVIQALKMDRFCCEAKGMSAFGYMMRLAQGVPFAKPGDFIPPIPDDEDPRLRLQEAINADPELKDLPGPNMPSEVHQRCIKKLLQIFVQMFDSGSSEMYIARHNIQTMTIKDPTKLMASYLELTRAYDLSGFTDVRILADAWQRMLLHTQRRQRQNGGDSRIIDLYRRTAKEILDESPSLHARQVMYQSVAKIQTSLEGDRLVTEAEDIVGAGVTANRINFAKAKLQPVTSRMIGEWNRKNSRRNAIKSNSGALQESEDDGSESDSDPYSNTVRNSLAFHMAKIGIDDPEQYDSEFGNTTITGDDAKYIIGHAATIARKYECDQQDKERHQKQSEQKAKLQAEKSILEQAKSEAVKLVTEARTAIQSDLLAHQARIAQADYIPTPYNATDQDYINSSSGPAYLDYPNYPHVAEGHYNYVDPSFPPATLFSHSSPTPIFAQPGALYKQNAYTSMQRGRPPNNPAGHAMPKGYPPPPNPPNSGPPTPVDHCNICGLHKTECEAIGSRYTDPHTNISHCYLRDKIAGSFNLDFRALDALKLNNLTKDKRERVIAASAKYGVLYSAPPTTLAAYRDRFNVSDPAPTPLINPPGSA
jgi:hypothetical protein